MIIRTCFICRRAKPLHRFGKAVGRFRVCLRCRSMLEGGLLSPNGDDYIRKRLTERGVSPEDVETIISLPRKNSFWKILKDTLRGYPAKLK